MATRCRRPFAAVTGRLASRAAVEAACRIAGGRGVAGEIERPCGTVENLAACEVGRVGFDRSADCDWLASPRDSAAGQSAHETDAAAIGSHSCPRTGSHSSARLSSKSDPDRDRNAVVLSPAGLVDLESDSSRARTLLRRYCVESLQQRGDLCYGSGCDGRIASQPDADSRRNRRLAPQPYPPHCCRSRQRFAPLNPLGCQSDCTDGDRVTRSYDLLCLSCERRSKADH